MREILWSVAGFLCIVIFTLAMKSLRIYIFVSCVLVVLRRLLYASVALLLCMLV